MRTRLLIVGLFVFGCATRAAAPAARARVTVTQMEFGGWAALKMSDGSVEVVVVPGMGRVMAFGFAGVERTPFWKHPRFGVGMGADKDGWINFGGDKAWPAPQDGWAVAAGKGWPPPRTFDQEPFAATVVGDTIEIVSKVDAAYGVLVRRRIALVPGAAEMTIETRYEKVEGAPVRVGVWTITQLASPERMAARLPERSTFPGGYVRRIDVGPLDLRVDGRLLSLARDPAAKTMIGTDAEALAWVGVDADVLVEKVAEDGDGEWPGGAHAQIYTSSDDAEPYVELELFGRVREMRSGDSASIVVRYTLAARREADPIAEARRVLALP